MNESELAAIEARLAAEERECLRYHTSPSNYAVEVSLADAQALCAEVKRLRAALAHYADEATWGPSPTRTDGSRFVYRGAAENGYDAARAALGGTGEDG